MKKYLEESQKKPILRFEGGSAAATFTFIFAPWILLEKMTMVAKPTSYISSTIKRAFGKAALFGISLGIVYLSDHISLSWN